MAKSIQELVNDQEIRLGQTGQYVGDWGDGEVTTAEQVAKATSENYAGAAVLSPSDSLPDGIDPSNPHVWVMPYYHTMQSLADDPDQYNRKRKNPDLWIVEWSTEEIEKAWQAAKRSEGVVSREEFDIRRSGSVDQSE